MPKDDVIEKAEPTKYLCDAGAIGGTLKKMSDAGFTDNHFDRIRTDGQAPFLKKIVELALQGGITELPEAEIRLRQVLGERKYFGVRDWSIEYWVLLDEKQRENFPPISDEFLKTLVEPCHFYPKLKVKDTHSVYLGIDRVGKHPITIDRLSQLRREGTKSIAADDNVRNQKYWNKTTLDYRWYLALERPQPDTFNKTLSEQVAAIPPNYQAMNFCTAMAHCQFSGRNWSNYPLYPYSQTLFGHYKCPEVFGRTPDLYYGDEEEDMKYTTSIGKFGFKSCGVGCDNGGAYANIGLWIERIVK